MRNTLLILIAVLMVVAGALAMFSSSGEYLAEKLFFQAMQTGRQIALNPDVAPQAMLNSAKDKLLKIIEKYPRAEITKQAYFALAEFYLTAKDYEQARLTVDKVGQIYSGDKDLLARAYLLKAEAFGREDLTEKAIQQLEILRDKYRDTLIGLSAPLYIGDYYTRKGKLAEAEQAYNEAALFYEQLKTYRQGESAGYMAANFLVKAYLNLRQYEQAGKTLEGVLYTYPQLPLLAQQLPNIDLIFIKLLKKPEKAIEVYTNIKERVREPELKKALQQRIEALKAEK